MAVSDEGGKVIFLRKLLPGGADRSYGIHVGQLAGLPRSVVHRAEELLLQFEGMTEAETGATRSRPAHNGHHQPHANGQSSQMSLFATATQDENPIVSELAALKVAELTPLEAINKLYELQQKASKKQSLDS